MPKELLKQPSQSKSENLQQPLPFAQHAIIPFFKNTKDIADFLNLVYLQQGTTGLVKIQGEFQKSYGNQKVQEAFTILENNLKISLSMRDQEKTGDEEKTEFTTWLETKSQEIEQYHGVDKVRRSSDILAQVEQRTRNLNARQQGTTTSDSSLHVPSEWIKSVRKFINILEVEEAGVPQANNIQPGGSLYSENKDWNSILGVPQYRTQSDNLSSPEATCNVTSFAMGMERLGYSRNDLLQAVDRLLLKEYQSTQKASQEHKENVPESYRKKRILDYIQKNDKEAEDYRKLRGGHLFSEKKIKEKNNQINELAENYEKVAQLEDLLDFYLFLKGIHRTAVNSDNNPKSLLAQIAPDKNHRTNRFNSWNANIKEKVNECLNAGGAAILSIHHKGQGKSGTHIVSVQSLTQTGWILDDPYGKINPDYRRNLVQDAYAPTGSRKRTNQYKNKPDYLDTDDWKLTKSQDLKADESKGNASEVSDDLVKSAFNYILLMYRR